MTASLAQIAAWGLVAMGTAGVILRPFGWPEYIWAVVSAALLVILQLLSWHDALAAVAKGIDVYLFLIGMMLLAEIARQEGLFDWLAAHAVGYARNSARRLFFIVYIVGTVVTVFLSNDATAVVLTPAVYAATRAAKVEPLPYLYICAFIANAASFVLPISNPANIVVYGDKLPPLMAWLRLFALPSLAAIVATYVALRFTQRSALNVVVASPEESLPLSLGGKLAASGICLAATGLIVASSFGRDLGLPTFVAGVATAGVVLAATRTSPLPVIRGVSWSVLPLVAGLFVLVEALNKTGLLPALASALERLAQSSPGGAAWMSGLSFAVASNLANNLPIGLIAATVNHGVQLPETVTAAILIGVDLGPNLSVTGSLATILWLIALRREGELVSALQFLKVGAIVMPPALILALATLIW
ncbi:arsenic transporter [Rhodopseudomonas palustris]|uniref:Arsenic transporter n=1 Tax=Rhodopseudomonas palustris TaxID=1076 RepID=A0A0D7F318_RHOPL|nr:arsenic transporter [Rhodopseudomonas palustris]